jgi:hypothetical protein
MFLSVCRNEPSLGFYDDAVRKFKVRCVGSNLVNLILDLELLILERYFKALELV